MTQAQANQPAEIPIELEYDLSINDALCAVAEHVFVPEWKPYLKRFRLDQIKGWASRVLFIVLLASAMIYYGADAGREPEIWYVVIGVTAILMIGIVGQHLSWTKTQSEAARSLTQKSARTLRPQRMGPVKVNISERGIKVYADPPARMDGLARGGGSRRDGEFLCYSLCR